MKILHIINSLTTGGAEKLIDDLLPLLKNNHGIDVSVLLLTDERMFFKENLEENDIPIDIVKCNKNYSFKNIYHIRKYIKTYEFDLVHAHLFPTTYWLALATKLRIRKKPKLMMTEHSTHNRRRDKKILKPLEKYIYSHYDKVISISEGTQENLIKWLQPRNKDKFIVIPNGIDFDTFNQATPLNRIILNDELTAKDILLCMVGSLSPQKDQSTIIRSLKHLDENVKLILVGDGPRKEEIKNLISDLGLIHRVFLLGNRRDVPNILKTIDIPIVSSKWEGFGLVAVEGMAAGKPLIASNISGLNSIVEGAGLLFEQGNEQDLAQKIKQLITNYEYYEATKAHCLKRSNLYNISNMAEKYNKSYLKVLSK